MKRNTSSVRKLWVLVAAAIVCVGVVQCSALGNALGVPDMEYNALVALYNSTNGDGWENHKNWLTSNGPWYGVTVKDGHVTDIRLDWNQLTGTIPVELGDLVSLQWLSLYYNQLVGTIPAQLGNLTNLRSLDLRDNQLTGALSAEMGSLASLQSLLLDSNQLTGTIPAWLGDLANLGCLHLGSNQFTGPIPSELGNLANLQYLSVGGDQVTGTIPPELGRLVNLQQLSVGGDQLTGTIPPELGKLVNLQLLSVGGSQLTGTIPPELGKLAKLQDLHICDTQLTGPVPSEFGNLANLRYMFLEDNQLTDPVPSALGNLVNLQYLSLHGNRLAGAIPAWLDHITNLQSLDLGDNELTGLIPSELGHLTNLYGLSLDNNRFLGAIPSWLGNLANLRWLDLSGNQFASPIPSELGNLTNLYDLSLGNNRFAGPIPAWLGNLPSLELLSIGGNQFTGSIPPELGGLTDLYSLSLGHNQLTGPIPSELAGLTKLWWLDMSGNQFTGEVPSWITNLTALSYLYVDYNGFSSSDPAVLAFLANKQPDWQSSQTVPPKSVSVVIQPSGAYIFWSSVASAWLDGYFEVGYSSTPGGPYIFDPVNVTHGLWMNYVDIVGLDLSHPAYLVVRTVLLPSTHNQSTLTSQLSPEVKVLPPPIDKQGEDGSAALLRDVIVTAVLPDCFYVEKRNRAWGIRVDLDDAYFYGYYPEQGQWINLAGTLYTNEDGERCIQNANWEWAGPPVPGPNPEVTSDVKPVYMTQRTLGGGDYRYDPVTGAGQRGVDGGLGLNNIGVLVTTTGRVILAGREWLYIDDGSRLDDGSGIRGLYVETQGSPAVSNGATVRVTGISGADRYHGRIVNVLRAIDVDVISSLSSMRVNATSTSGADPANPRKD